MVALLMLAMVVPAEQQLISVARRALVVSSALLSLLVLLRLATHPSLFMTVDAPDEMINDGGRALSAQGAFLMVLASGVLTSEFLAQSRFAFDRMTFAVIALPILILLTRQGTANIAEIAMLGTVVFFQRGSSQSVRIVFGALAAMLITMLLVFLLPALRDNADLIQRANNLGTREEVWTSLMAIWPSQPISIQLFGFPAGQQLPLQVYLGGSYRLWEYGIHSMYYGALPMMGYVGAVAYVAMLTLLLWGTLRGSLRKFDPLPASSLGLCVATAILSYSYEVRNEATFGLFLAILWLRAYPGAQRRVA